MVYKYLAGLRAWLLPAPCLLCGGATPDGADFCPGCAGALPEPGPSCPQCAVEYTGAGPCGRCQSQPPAYSRALAALPYRPPIDRLITGLKYHGRLAHARALGELLAAAIRRRHTGPWPDWVVPVPLHASRLRERGFNQALEIARPVARALKLPLAPRALQRTRATAAQAGLDRAARARNLRDAFSPGKEVGGLHIALIDDVMTSGHTADAAARALCRGGAETVTIWVVARA